MSSPADRPDRTSPDDALPPVEPPSAGFILQLFVVPAVIVTIIIVIWLGINWLAHMGSDPTTYVQALKRNNEARWQAAYNLADALRDPTNTELKHNHQMAQELAEILEGQLAEKSDEENDLKLRYYLCTALGGFRVDEVVPPLVATIRSQQSEDQREVLLAALISLTLHIEETKDFDLAAHPELTPLLIEQSRAETPLIRSTAAFSLGALAKRGSQPAQDRLEVMANDPYPDVRYNAATRLARLGSPAAIDVLVEMLDPRETKSVELEKENAQGRKRQEISLDALAATRALAAADASIDLSRLNVAVEKLRSASPSTPVALAAQETLNALAQRPARTP